LPLGCCCVVGQVHPLPLRLWLRPPCSLGRPQPLPQLLQLHATAHGIVLEQALGECMKGKRGL